MLLKVMNYLKDNEKQMNSSHSRMILILKDVHASLLKEEELYYSPIGQDLENPF